MRAGQQEPPSPRLSSCSSIIASRLDALQLQLQEERKRRLEVERAITSFESTRGEAVDPSVPTSMPALVRLTSAALKRNPPQPPPAAAAECASQRSAAVASCSSSAPRSVDGTSERSGNGRSANRDKRPASGLPKPQNSPASVTRSDPFQIPKRLKDPLPPQARGGSSNPMFGKRKVSDVDIYLAQARHEQRMQALHQFQLPDL